MFRVALFGVLFYFSRAGIKSPRPVFPVPPSPVVRVNYAYFSSFFMLQARSLCIFIHRVNA